MSDLARLQEVAADPKAFRSLLALESGVFTSDSWQRADFEILDGGWRRIAAGQVEQPCFMRAWFERPRAHSKTTDLAIMATWPMAFSRRRLRGVAVAADADQAEILKDQIGMLVRCNGWLSELLDVQRRLIPNVHTGSELRVISSDVSSSYGLLVDFILADEISNWAQEGLWISLISTAGKKSGMCLVCAISNAGVSDSGRAWQWQAREKVRKDQDWHFHSLPGTVATWISPESLAEQRRLLPDLAFRRLWANEWTTGQGDALQEDDIAAAVVYKEPMTGSEAGYSFVAGLDIGLSQDASALAIIGKQNDTRKLRLAHCQVWKPSGKRLDLSMVEQAVADLHKRFQFRVACYDPFQAIALAQSLSRAGVPMREVAFTPANLTAMATAVLDAFTSRSIELYDDGRLLADLRQLRCVERSYGVRLDSPRGPSGHGDAATALSLALLGAKDVSAHLVFPQLHGEAFDRDMEAARIKWAALYAEFDATQPPDWGFASR